MSLLGALHRPAAEITADEAFGLGSSQIPRSGSLFRCPTRISKRQLTLVPVPSLFHIHGTTKNTRNGCSRSLNAYERTESMPSSIRRDINLASMAGLPRQPMALTSSVLNVLASLSPDGRENAQAN